MDPIKLADAMTRNGKVFVVSEKMPLFEAVQIMKERRLHHLIVWDNGKIVGLLSDRSIFETVLLQKGVNSVASATVKDAMLIDIPYLDETSDLGRAIHLMRLSKTTGLPLVREGELIGILTESDVLRILDAKFEAAEEEFSVGDKSQVYMANPLVQNVMNLLAQLGF